MFRTPKCPKSIRYFLLGMLEFRDTVTLAAPEPYEEVYDKGRDFAHRLTFRKYD